MAAQGDIVFMIGADVAGLTQAGSAGEKSLADMERAAKTLERQIGKVGQAGVDFQRDLNGLTGVTREFSKSARDSAAAFDAFDKSRAQVDNLRASIDPLFAASKRYEAALVQLDGALENGSISAREHANMVDLVAQSYLRADNAQVVMSKGMMGMTRNMQGGAGGFQNVGYQIQDFAVQVGAGTSAMQAFGQQLPQLASGFGPVGIAVGTFAAVAIPLLAAAFGSASSGAKNFEDALSAVETSLNDLRAISALYGADGLDSLTEKYGVLNAEVATHIQRMREVAEQTALANSRAMIEQLIDDLGGLNGIYNGLRDTFGLIEDDAVQLGNQMRWALREEEPAKQAAALEVVLSQIDRISGGYGKMDAAQRMVYDKIVQTVDQLRILSAAQPGEGWLSSAFAQAQSLGAALWEAVRAKAALSGEAAAGPGMTTGNDAFAKNGLGFNLPGGELLPAAGAAEPTGASGGGGGGGVSDPIAAEIERLQQALMTEEQLEMESYAKRQAMLQQALEQRVVTQEDYAKLMENAQAQHQDRMSGIDVYRYGTGLQQAEAFMGGMASALQGGNEQMQKISRVFGAAEALINAWRAFSQTMADPSLPFFAKFGAAASVLSAGMGAVNAIKSGSKSSGAASGGAARASAAVAASSGAGGGSASPAAAAAPDQSQIVNISLTGDTIGRDGMASLFDQINKGLAKGYRIERVNFT